MIYRQTLATALLLAVMGTPAVAQTAAKKPPAAAAQLPPNPPPAATWYRRRSSTLSSRNAYGATGFAGAALPRCAMN